MVVKNKTHLDNTNDENVKESNMSLFFKGISVQTICSFTLSLLQIIMFSFFSRVLSRVDFGYYAAMMGVISIIMSISDAGIGASVIQKQKVNDRFLSTAFTLSLVIGSFFSFLLFMFTNLISTVIADETIIVPLRLLSITIMLYSIQSYAVSLLRKKLKFKMVGLLRICSYSISSIIAISYAINVGGIYSIIVLYILDSFLFTIFLFLNVKLPRIFVDFKMLKSILSFGGWLTLGVIITNISNQIDKLLLGRMLSVKSLGEYNRPSGFIANIIGLVNSIFDTVLFPLLSKHQDSKNKMKEIFYQSNSLLTCMGVVMAVLLFINSHFIIYVFLGVKWIDLVPIMQIASLSGVFMLNNTLADCFFRSYNLVRFGCYIRLFGFFIYLLSLFIGVRFGIIGVAFSVLISNLIVVIIKYCFLINVSKANALSIINSWVASVKPIIPLLLFSLCLSSMSNDIFRDIILLLGSIIIILVEMKYIPSIFGDEYVRIVNPKFQILFKKIKL